MQLESQTKEKSQASELLAFKRVLERKTLLWGKQHLISSSPSTGWDWEAIWTCSKQGKKECDKVGQGNKPQYP